MNAFSFFYQGIFCDSCHLLDNRTDHIICSDITEVVDGIFIIKDKLIFFFFLFVQGKSDGLMSDLCGFQIKKDKKLSFSDLLR